MHGIPATEMEFNFCNILFQVDYVVSIIFVWSYFGSCRLKFELIFS